MPEISKEEFARTREAIETFGLDEIHHARHQPIIMAALDLAASASSPEPETPTGTTLHAHQERAKIVAWLRTAADHRADNVFDQLAARIAAGEHDGASSRQNAERSR